MGFFDFLIVLLFLLIIRLNIVKYDFCVLLIIEIVR